MTSNFAYLASKNNDGNLKWIYDMNPGRRESDLFFADDSVKAEKPENLSEVKLFRDIGMAVFRSGFGDDDFAFIFRCGPFYNHQHFDQGSFYFVDRGETFLTEVGKTDYYDDPWYQRLAIQPGGHNCILINGNVKSCFGVISLLHFAFSKPFNPS